MIMNTSDDIAVLILAAGESKRMGEPKQLLPWKETTLLGHTISIARSVTPNVFIVLGANYEKISKSKGLENAKVVFNAKYKSGQGSSLSVGIEYLDNQEQQFEGVLVLLCDQPLITSNYLKNLLVTFSETKKGIVATKYNNKAGVPAIFQNKYFDKLKNIVGDKGAKTIIGENTYDVYLFDAQGQELDVDTKEEYERLVNHLKP